MKVIEKNFVLGVGTGDDKGELIKQYELDNQEYLRKGQYNTHNQFLDYWVTFGIVGLALFLLFVALAFKLSFQYKNLLGAIFMIATICFFFVENVLSVQRGVVFVSFFYSLMVFNPRPILIENLTMQSLFKN